MSQSLLIHMVTHVFASIGISISLLAVGATSDNASEDEFDVEAPYGFVGPIALKNSRLLALDRMTMTRLFSMDGGGTWKAGGALVDAEGRMVLEAAHRRGHLPSILRLASGGIAVKYNVADSDGDTSKLIAFVVQSIDDGATWSKPIRITPPGSRSNATWLVQTSKGRWVLPSEYWFTQPGDRGIGICAAFYSETNGQTWRESRDTLWVWEKGGVEQGSCEVPIVVETAGGKLLMFMRTWYQRVAQSYSEDGGETWSPATLNDLVSSNSEIFLTCIPKTNDLLCVWNQADTQEIHDGYYRARLTAAISKDSGASWSHFRTVRQSPGQRELGRIPAEGEPKLLRTPIAVPTEKKMLAGEFHMNRAPRIHFVDDRAFVRYTHRRYKYVAGKLQRFVNQTRLRVVASEWFYESGEAAK